MKALLNVIDGPEKGKSFELKIGTYILGRSQGEIRLADKKVSSRHCEIHVSKTECWIEDLNSTNGTFVGGSQLHEKRQLQNLDILTVGLSRISINLFEDIAQAINEIDLELETKPEASAEEISEPTQEPSDAASQSNFETLHQPSTELPKPDSLYRETGVVRIGSLIESELETLSKWDHPAHPDDSEPSFVPKIKVILKARQAPEGLSEIVCSQAITNIGRKDVDVRINDLDLSRKHCAIEIIAGTQVMVRDLGSTNGTYVNGKKISAQEVKNGDLIQIGQSLLEVFIQRS